MAADGSSTKRAARLLECLVFACFAAGPLSLAEAAEQGTLIIRHVPDFSKTRLVEPRSPPGKSCQYSAIDCDDFDMQGTTPDREGLGRDTKYFIGVQVATIGLLYLMPESISSWSEEEKDDYSLSKWWDNIRHPKRDTDDHFINYVLHPYCGAAYFVRARERGYDNRHAFWYSVLLSSAYEFGPEAMFESPSIQDLIVTPVVGSMVGRYFMNVRTKIESRSAERGYRTRGERLTWALTDPLGAVNHRIDHLLGRDAKFRISPYFFKTYLASSPIPGYQVERDTGIGAGLRIEIRW